MDERGLRRLAKEAIQRGDNATARAHLLEIVRVNPRSEVAWLWLSAIIDDPEKEWECLKRVLAINPNNALAQQHLERLRSQGEEPLRWGPRIQVQPEPSPASAPVSRKGTGSAEASWPAPSLLEFYGAGLVLPTISPTFYWHASRRRPVNALYFFLLFALVLTVIQGLGISRTFGTLGREAERAFASGAFPQITISGGRATIQGADPFVQEFEGGILILDTSGQYSPSVLQSGRYNTGFLLTETDLYNLNRGQLQRLRLGQLQTMLGDPFTLNAQVIRGWLNMVQAFVFVVLLIGNTAGRLLLLGLLALGIRAVASSLWTGVTLGPVFAVGAYAMVANTYGSYLLRRIGIRFCGLGAVLLLIPWAVGLVTAFSERGEGILKGGRPLRSWRALIGVPMLLVMTLDAAFSWPRGGILVVGVAVITLVALAFVGLWPMLGGDQAARIKL